MFCSQCGQQIAEGSAFCPLCGTPQPVQPPYPQPVQTQYEQSAQTQYQPTDPQYQQPYYYQPVQPALPMKWFKFLIYFSLLAAFVMNLIYGFNYITGGIYMIQEEIEASAVYEVFPSMKWIDIVFGLYQIAVAVFCVIVRQALVHYKANGPRLLLGLYLIQMIASLLYQIACAVVVGTSGAEMDITAIAGSCVGAVVGGLILILCNKTYFDKRAHLFIY